MFTKRNVITLSTALFLATWAPAAKAQERLPVVASFSILGDFVKQVGGDRVSVTTLVGPDGDGHVYAPTPADTKATAEAHVIFVNGLGFEGWMERLAQSSATKAQLVTASHGIKPVAFDEGEEHDEKSDAKDHNGHAKEAKHGDEHDGHHEGPDPHAWQSIGNAKIYVANIRDALIKADPAGKAEFEAKASAYLAELDTLEVQVRAAIDALPKERRTIITSHDAFGYFAATYGVEVVAPQGVSTESEASAKEVAALIRQIKAEKVKAVFVENITDPRLINRIAEEGGAKLGGRLYSDALSPPDGPAGTYIDMMQHNIRTLSAGLSS